MIHRISAELPGLQKALHTTVEEASWAGGPISGPHYRCSRKRRFTESNYRHEKDKWLCPAHPDWTVQQWTKGNGHYKYTDMWLGEWRRQGDTAGTYRQKETGRKLNTKHMRQGLRPNSGTASFGGRICRPRPGDEGCPNSKTPRNASFFSVDLKDGSDVYVAQFPAMVAAT